MWGILVKSEWSEPSGHLEEESFRQSKNQCKLLKKKNYQAQETERRSSCLKIIAWKIAGKMSLERSDKVFLDQEKDVGFILCVIKGQWRLLISAMIITRIPLNWIITVPSFSNRTWLKCHDFIYAWISRIYFIATLLHIFPQKNIYIFRLYIFIHMFVLWTKPNKTLKEIKVF